LLGKWDNDLALDIMSHWSDLIDEDGWVGREQILGDEARSKVPVIYSFISKR
jgi:mannosyl-oligosaccharide glucosidase